MLIYLVSEELILATRKTKFGKMYQPLCFRTQYLEYFLKPTKAMPYVSQVVFSA